MKLDLYLILGLTKESRHWSRDFLDALDSRFRPHSIQAVDLPGSGRFLDQRSPSTMEGIVDRSRAQLTFHPGHRRLVISASLGGMSAWSWAARYPDDFTHLVMINSSLGNLSPFWKRIRPIAVSRFAMIGCARRGAGKERLILELCSNNAKNANRIHPHWAKLGVEANMSRANAIRQIVAGMKFKPERIPDLPTLVIASKHDRLAHYHCSEAIASHAAAEIALFDDPAIGHAFHVDAPALLAETIGEWASRNGIGPETSGEPSLDAELHAE